MHVAITGATGLIGTALTAKLEADGHRVSAVSRQPGRGIGWDPAAGTIDAGAFVDVDAVVHLAGEPIGERRWNDEVKSAIRDSRVLGTRLLATTLAGLDRPPKVLLSGSAIGCYGDRGDEILTEASPQGEGFLADVVRDWEAETAPAEQSGIRVAHLRTGLVLAPKGGAMGKMLPLFKLGLGGRLGSGDQYWSWISIDDHVALTAWLLEHEVHGAINLTGPEPVTNAAFTKALGNAVHRPTLLPVPAFGPKLLLGAELADELLFTSARVLPSAAIEAGYAFRHPTVHDALDAIT